jgi:hypothetical protein
MKSNERVFIENCLKVAKRGWGAFLQARFMKNQG